MRLLALVVLLLLLLAAAGIAAPQMSPETRAALAQLEAWGKAFAELARIATPSVVNVNTTTVIPGRTVSSPDPFDLFFGGRSRRMLRIPQQEVHSLGSGVIVAADGFVVTNNHVIADATTIKCSLADGREFEAQRRGTDPDTDIAVLKIAATDLPALEWGDSDALEVGEWVIAVGNPYGFSHSVTAGIVSAKGRREVAESPLQDFIQTDAAINPGNSGGALLNLRGELVGINTAIFSRSGGYQGIGFAVPAKIAQDVSERLIRFGDIVRGWIGVEVRALPTANARHLGLGDKAVYLRGIYEKSPAEAAGLKEGDIVRNVDGQSITRTSELQSAIIKATIGQKLKLEVLRQDGLKTIEVPVIARPKEENGQSVGGI